MCRSSNISYIPRFRRNSSRPMPPHLWVGYPRHLRVVVFVRPPVSVFAPRDGESAPLPHELCRLLPAWPALLQRVHAARPCRAPTRASTLAQAASVSNAAAGVRAWMELRVPLALVAWGDPRGFPRPVGPVSPLFMIRDKIVGFHDATRLATLHNSAMPGPLTPSQSQRHGVSMYGDDDPPL